MQRRNAFVIASTFALAMTMFSCSTAGPSSGEGEPPTESAVVEAPDAATPGDAAGAAPRRPGDAPGAAAASPAPSDGAVAGEAAAPAPKSLAAVSEAGGLRVMTYNIKHGELSSLDSIANVIKGQAPDLVALQEVDSLTNRSGKVDQAKRLGELTGMGYTFVPALLSFDGGQYGLALLSRYPILSSQRVALRSAAEQRALGVVEVELDPQHVITVGVTHFGTTGASERSEQADDVKAALTGKPGVVLAGDLNATPGEACITSLKQAFSDAWTRGGSGNGYTISASFPTKRIDYIFLGPSWTSPLSAQVVGASSQSDHRPVVASVIKPWSQTLFGDRTPGNAVEEDDTRAVEIGVKFRSNVAGTIESVRFYRGTGNAAGYVAHLWASDGTLLAQANVPAGPNGWHEARFATPVAVAAGATYVASYFTSNGRFARDPSGLVGSVTSGNLTAPGSASAGGNGVYVYGNGGFPASTYKDTNYWVDVRFAPAP
jgi:endonuclease/exonuclease/phosphatase family metal-dependent hydrolase